MIFTKRKAEKTQKWKIEDAIQRCYGSEKVALALCGSEKFIGFNFGHGSQISQRQDFVEDSFRMHGVVHEFSSDEQHIPCEVELSVTHRIDDTIGHLVLTTTTLLNWERVKERIKLEELELALHVHLFVTAQFRLSLFDGLRDAALSGFRFMHVGLTCQKPSEEDIGIATAQMRENGYAPMRKIVEVKMWPKLELQNAPNWARKKD